MAARLTQVQARVLDVIRRRVDAGEPPPTYRELCTEFGWSSTGTARDHLRALARKGFVELSQGRSRQTRLSKLTPILRVPVVGHVVAGSPVPAEEVVEGDVPVPSAWMACSTAFALRVHGDSMVGAGIADGDLVVVRRQRTAKDGDIVAATIGAETTLKRLRRVRGRVVLRAENPEYPDIEIGDQDLMIHGVVVGLLRQLHHRRPGTSRLGDAK
jgi:repressor LexA